MAQEGGQVPTGFVHPDDPQVNPEGEDLLGDLEKNFTKIPCTLYTDGHGINFFVIDVDDKKYVLNVRTD